MRIRLLVASLASLLVPGVCLATAADRDVERGIVQSISAGQLVLRALDGSDVPVVLGSATRFRLNGMPATIAEVRPGQVAEAVVVGDGPARVVRAFGRRTTGVADGVILSISRSSVELTRTSGGTVSIAITPRTTVRIGLIPARRHILKSGQEVHIVLAPDGSARTVVVRRGRR